MSVQVCKMEIKVMSMADLTGPDCAGRWFGYTMGKLEDVCGRFTKGRNKGELRGWIVYRKVLVGGWCYPLQCVLRPGMMFGHFVAKYNDLGHYINLSTNEFFPNATRVDTCYGHDPVKSRLEREQSNAKVASSEGTEPQPLQTSVQV